MMRFLCPSDNADYQAIVEEVKSSRNVASLILDELRGMIMEKPKPAKFMKACFEGNKGDTFHAWWVGVDYDSTSGFTFRFAMHDEDDDDEKMRQVVTHTVLANYWYTEYANWHKEKTQVSISSQCNAWVTIGVRTHESEEFYLLLDQILSLRVRGLDHDAVASWLFYLRHPGSETVVVSMNQFGHIRTSKDESDVTFRCLSPRAVVKHNK